jgi:hypothetical protein
MLVGEAIQFVMLDELGTLAPQAFPVDEKVHFGVVVALSKGVMTG